LSLVKKRFNEIIACEEGIAMASQVLINISKDEVERARLLSEYKYEVDTQSKIVHARREGLREGLQEGERQGIRKIVDLLKNGASQEDILKEYGE
jgi:hypothetical protein